MYTGCLIDSSKCEGRSVHISAGSVLTLQFTNSIIVEGPQRSAECVRSD